MTNPHENTDGRTEETRRREAAVREMILRAGERLSRDDIKDVTGKLGVSRATAYRMIKTFRSCGAVTDPAARPVGRPKGARVLDPAREALIREAIVTIYFRPTPPKFSQLLEQIKACCEAKGLPVPNWRTIRTRLCDLDAERRARRNELQ